MKILSFDTSNNLASVALMDDGHLLTYHSTKQNSQQAEKLFQLIGLGLQEENLKLTDIDLVSVTNGPGSFTGVRIAIAAALGLQIGCACQFIALTNFQVLAYYARSFYSNQKIAVILDARRNQVYFQLFDAELKNLSEPLLLTIEALPNHLPKDVILVGDGIKFLSIPHEERLCIIANAKILAEASEFYWRHKLYHDLVPLYIREPDAVQLDVYRGVKPSSIK